MIKQMEYPQAEESLRKLFIDSLSILPGHRVLVIGDIMVDAYLTGEAERISPEAPVPIVRVTQESQGLGGAGNVARNLAALQAATTLISVCGEDQAGDYLQSTLFQNGINGHIVSLPGRPTTIKTRIIAQRQQMLRFDREDPTQHSQDETKKVLEAAAGYIPQAHAIIISDYGKGLVTPCFMQKIHTMCLKQDRAIPILVDPKPMNKDCYSHVTLLTPNTKETAALAHMPAGSKEEIIAAGKKIKNDLQVPYLLTTLGPDGMAVFEQEEVWHIPTTARKVYDVTGAGDTVIATTALALAAKIPLVQACMLANYAAGIVVGEVGAATATLDALQKAIEKLPVSPPTRWE